MAGTAHGESVAIIGMGCRLPGDVHSPDDLWRLLLDGVDAVGDCPPERVPDGAHRPGGYLRDVCGFDAPFFGISGGEADVLDPQHRLLLEVTWEALDHAGIPPDSLAGSATGVYTGISYDDYLHRLAGRADEVAGSVLTNGHCVAPGRVSYLLGLRGPAVALDTACSSSLVAVHLAAQALRSGEVDLATAGGVTLILSDRTTTTFTKMGMLSGGGRCLPFAAGADGFTRGEGCGVVVLKRLSDARRDGDRVLALLRGSAVNQDGRSDGLSAPSADAQHELFLSALAAAGVDPAAVGLVEAHGTGTPVGDPAEFDSLSRVYGPGPGRCALGSVKTNLGHLEPAAGVTGLIKAVLCLRAGRVPANPNFGGWSPALDPTGTRFFVPTETVDWPVEGRTRLAAVSSFGYSGTNAHVVLEQAPDVPVLPAPRGARGPEALLVPAGSPGVLPTAAERVADWLETADAPIRDVLHTLATRRGAGRGRLGVVGRTRAEFVAGLRAFAAGRHHPAVVSGSVGAGVTRTPVWVFSGQGSQWAGMGAALLEGEPAFAAAIAALDPLIAAETGWSVREVLRSGAPVTGCARVQPVLFAMQVALAETWRAHGVEPAAVIGHSMGEVAAAVVAGALTPADGAAVICRRSALLATIAGAGAMAAVGLGRARVEADIADQGASATVSVAVLAGPESTVVAGDTAAVGALVAQWDRRGVPARPVAVDVASHSPQVDCLLDDLARALADLAPRPPRVRFHSTVAAGGEPAFDADYWCANLRRPVRFAQAVAAAAAERAQVFIEVSPHPIVTRALADCLADPAGTAPGAPNGTANGTAPGSAGAGGGAVILPTLRRDEDERATFVTQLAAAHCAGVAVDWSVRVGDGALTDVPPIVLDRVPHWVDLDDELSGPPATLPGARAEVPGTPLRQHWRGDAGTARLPWLADHRVSGGAVLPGAAYCAIALTAAVELFQADPTEVEVADVAFHDLLRLGDRTPVSTVVTRVADDRAECAIHAPGDDGWTEHATATLRRVPALAPEPPADRTACPDRAEPAPRDPEGFYAALRSRGIEHGPAFAGITALAVAGREVRAEIEPPAECELLVHPVLLDLCAQTLVAALPDSDRLALPTGVASLRVVGDPSSAVRCRATVTATDETGATGDVEALDAAGRVVLAVRGLTVVTGAARAVPVDRWFIEPRWVETPAPEPAGSPGHWLLLGPAGPLAGALRRRGAEVDHTSDLELDLDREPDLGAARAVVVRVAPTGGRAEDPEDGVRITGAVLSIAQRVAAGPAEGPRLYLVAPPGPVASALRGLVRVLAHEHPRMRATLITTHGNGPDGGEDAVAAELLGGADDDEVSLCAGVRAVARLGYAPLTPAERDTATACAVRHGRDRYRLRATRLGDLDGLRLSVAPPTAPVGDQVEIRVGAAGINFRDVLTAMGLLPGEGAGDRIGFECSGVVAAVGPDVDALRVGDPVVGIGLDGGAFASHATLSERWVARIPDGLDPVAAAGVPAVFATAWYALREVARLRAGERVLVHSATGGTGLAAIAVARLLGAEVVATAGTAAKRDHLRALGVEHVLDSRTLDFAEEVTALGGVDVVLNSLSGPAIRAGLRTLRPFGRFVELGVRDILADTPLGLAPLRHNITLASVDLVELQRSRPEVFARVLREVLGELAAGRLAPVPHSAFPVDRATDAFRLMAAAGHVGKLVLTVPGTGEAPAVREPVVARPDGAYIVTGGLRGVGLATARWLAEEGAGHLVLNGRSAPTAAARAALDALRASGVRVDVVLGDVAEDGTAAELVAAAGPRLRGVVHSAMVLDDAVVTTATAEQLSRVWRPKAIGAWRLHEAVACRELDWFVLHSSMASLLGNAGQAAYAAANGWLDGFARWRTELGLPTLAVDWGPWGETGVATDFAERGYDTIATADGMRALRELLAHGRVRTGVVPGPPETWVPAGARHAPVFADLLAAAAPTTSDLPGRLRALPPGPLRHTALESFLTGEIQSVLRLGGASLDPQTPLRSLGFDSLLSIELRTRLESALGVALAANFVWRHPTAAALAEGLAEHLALDLTGSADDADAMVS